MKESFIASPHWSQPVKPKALVEVLAIFRNAVGIGNL